MTSEKEKSKIKGSDQLETSILRVGQLVFILLFLVRSLAMLVTHPLTHSLPNSCSLNLIDVTLACEDASLKLVEVVTVADVSDEDRVGKSLLHIWKLRFGHKA